VDDVPGYVEVLFKLLTHRTRTLISLNEPERLRRGQPVDTDAPNVVWFAPVVTMSQDALTAYTVDALGDVALIVMKEVARMGDTLDTTADILARLSIRMWPDLLSTHTQRVTDWKAVIENVTLETCTRLVLR
jgi:hypothetical protein